jgi:hypothetical protein
VTSPVSSLSFMIRSSFSVSAGSRLRTSEIGAPPLSTALLQPTLNGC